jgi:riboflavin kinase / FMN adenylyltransferase
VGKSMGFPTINLTDTKVMLPGPGIYAALCDIGGNVLKAAAYIGSRPTMEAGFAVEAHLLGFEGDLYGERVTLRFVEHIRNDKKFQSPDELKRQIADDISRIQTVLESEHD